LRMQLIRKMAVPLFAVLLAGILFSLACNKNTPVSPRADLVNQGDFGNVLQRAQAATMDSTADSVVNTSASPLLLLGTLNNIESRILLRFDPLPDSGQIVAAKLLLPADTLMNGQTGSFEATMHQVTSPWNESEVTWGDNAFPVTFNPMEIDREEIVAPKADTVVFNLSPQLVETWLSSQGANIDTFGVMIQPQGAGFIKELYSRFSSAKQPALELNISTRISDRDTTIVIRYFATASVFVFQRMGGLSEKHLYVGSGERRQSVLLFDLSTIIPDTIPQSATINRATLGLQVDAANSFFVDSDNILTFSLYYALKKFALDTLKTTADSLSFVQVGSAGPSTATVEFNLTSLVQSWVRTPPEERSPPQNYGYLYLLPEFPTSSLARVAFYSRQENASHAPKISIAYTTPPKSK
jgi:hypothetical protein